MLNRIGFAAVLLLQCVLAGASDMIWVEGEAAKTKDVGRHPWWYDKVKKDELSGGDFISNWRDKPGEVAYDVNIPTEKEYFFWVRANPIGTKLSYAFDSADLAPIDMSKAVDSRNIAEDEKPDLRFLAWINVTKLKLTQGAHSIKFKMHSDNNNHGMLDCFVLTSDAFTPNGKLKPGEKEVVKVVTEEGRWAFVASKDEFSPDALLDLRSLNEQVAGESGFVKRSPDGSGFVLGNGKPIHFWAVNADAVNGHSLHGKPDSDHYMHFLAKRGINITRYFADIASDKTLDGIDEGVRDGLWKTVAAGKKQGIYTLFTPYWAGASKTKPALGFMDDGNAKWGLLFYDKKLQEAYKQWMKKTLTEKNPYTGIPLSEDPALAIIQLQNEDSMLFWTSQGIKGAAKKELRRQYGDFIKEKYKTFDAAKEAWGNAEVPKDQDSPDDFEKGEAALFIAWELTQHRNGDAYQKRVSDQMEFFCRKMYDFNKMMSDYLKNELGCKQLINACNWKTADNVFLNDGERWAYTPNEVMAVNRYYGGIHQGANCGWAICKGDKFTDECVLLKPRALPLTLKQVEGHPMLITESSWVPPQGYQSEGPFMIAAYQSLNGVAGYFWFAMGEEWADWQINAANGFMQSQGKWMCNTPMLLGQWPATALMYRMNYIQKGEPAVYEQRALKDIFSRNMPIIAEDEGYDPNRDKGLIPKESNVKDGVSPLAYLVGPVMVKYDGDPAKSTVADMNKYIDPAKKTVKSNTGELELNYGDGLCRLNAPKVQGVTGFLKKAGKQSFSDVEIDSKNDYATVLVVALDDKPLKTSAKVLVQVGTSERSTGWSTKPVKVENRDAEEIVSFGKGPWQIVKADLTVTINNTSLTKAFVLDANGMKVKELELQSAGTGKSFVFPADALYVALQ
jgi:hypothetical protein